MSYLNYMEEAGGVLELHVGDVHGTAEPEVARRCLEYWEKYWD